MDDHTPDDSPRPQGRSEGVTTEVVGQDYVLHDGASGRVHFLNETAALVWDLCDGTRTVDDIAADVGRRYGLPADAVRADVAQAVTELHDHDLLVRPVGP